MISGQGKTTVDCEACSAPIGQYELQRCLPSKTRERLANLDMRKQLRLAGFTDLDECPCVRSSLL